MGCNSDYLKPTDRERELRHAANLLIFVYSTLGETVSPALKAAAADMYCKDDYIPTLCARLKKLKRFNNDLFERLVYDAKSARSRELADWWEEHEKADKAREAKEKAEKERTQLRKQALAKLTPAERKALGYE